MRRAAATSQLPPPQRGGRGTVRAQGPLPLHLHLDVAALRLLCLPRSPLRRL